MASSFSFWKCRRNRKSISGSSRLGTFVVPVPRSFCDKPVLQFTATAFRGDGKHVDGKPIYNYPRRKAQSEGYFKPIDFSPLHGVVTRRDSGGVAKKLSAVFRRLSSSGTHPGIAG